MPGLHGQLTTAELGKALAATDVLLKLEPYIDRLTYAKISALDADLKAEQQERAGHASPAAYSRTQ